MDPTVVLVAVVFAAGGVLALVDPALLVSPHARIAAAAHVHAGY